MDTINYNLLADVTHELKTPISGVMGMVNLLYESELDKKQLEAVKLIELCCNNMDQIITDLLDLSKLKEGFPIEEKVFNTQEFMKSVFSVHLDKMERKGIKPILHINKSTPNFLVGDVNKLKRILHNFLSNAIKFTDSGYVLLQVYPQKIEGEKVKLNFSVIDTGIGIPKHEQEKLYKRYQQVNEETTTNYSGSGLGLYICKEMVHALGGETKLYSEYGYGSEFSVNISLKVQSHEVDTFSEAMDLQYLEQFVINKKEITENDIITFADLKEIKENKVNKKHNRQDNKEHNKQDYKEIELKVNDLADSNYYINDSIHNIISKLSLYMDNMMWEDAEELARVLKNVISMEQKSLRQEVFRLLLLLRKEEYEKALRQFHIMIEAFNRAN